MIRISHLWLVIMQTNGIAAADLCKLLKKMAGTMGFEPVVVIGMRY
jgi:hypothetical protein